MSGTSSPEDTKAEAPGFGMKMTIAGIKAKFSSVSNMATETLATLMSSRAANGEKLDEKTTENLVILDARPQEEFQISHIPGATRVDYESNMDNILQEAPQLLSVGNQTTVVCYCSVGYRSSMVASKLMNHYQKSVDASQQPKVYNLEGSLFKWANEGRAMVDDKGEPTVYAHPYNTMFGKLLKSELRKSSL